jgi:uncharacterized protein (TIRG00374 family)
MANARIKAVLQYLLMAALTAGLLWFSLRGLSGTGEDKGDFLWSTWKKAHKGYLFLMALFVMISHVLRAERWKMLLVPTGNKVRLSSSFLSLMIGYLVNLAIPRGGEVSRCYNLLKLENTPVETSFGTVVTERIVDVVCLLLLIGLCFIVEWTRLEQFINTLNFSSGSGFKIPWWIFLAAAIGVGALVTLFLLRKNKKLRKILLGFKDGLLSVFRLKNKGLFIFYSIAIWVLYGVMSWCVLQAFTETDQLGFSAVLTLFAIGSIAMAAPLPGGAGSYHTLVPLGLVMLYNLPRNDAVAFTFIFHAWQTLIMIVVGVISLIISYFVIRWRKVKTK